MKKVFLLILLLPLYVAAQGHDDVSTIYLDSPRKDELPNRPQGHLPFRDVTLQEKRLVRRFPQEWSQYFDQCLVCSDCSMGSDIQTGKEYLFKNADKKVLISFCYRSAVGSVFNDHPELRTNE